MATLGKAAGVYGAFVAGEALLIDMLVQRARTYIYTTATPPLLDGDLVAYWSFNNDPADDVIEDFAEMTGVELVVIDDDTTPRTFKRELRWNAAYHRLAEGL